MQLFYSILGSFMCGTCFLVVATPNPIHSILLLISVFFSGTILLFCLQMEYYASLFLIVYVGAIVVLFLFIISSLELKSVNITTSLTDLFSSRHIILFGLFGQILFFLTSVFFDLSQFVSLITGESAYLVEANQYSDWSKLISRPDQLRALGAILYTEYKVTIILASLLLFLSSVGALAVTLFFPKNEFSVEEINSSKLQDVNNQVMRHPAFTIKF